MNLATLDRHDLEEIVLNPSRDFPSALECAEEIREYLPGADSPRSTRLRHVLAAGHELLSRIANQAIVGRSHMDSPSTVKDYFRVYFAGAEHESFVVVFLDAQHRVIAAEDMFQGTLTQTSVYPREVVKRALAHNAGACIFAHCHPSGQAEPSRADELFTASLKQALSLVDVRVVDHMVVGGSTVVSFAERGLL